MRAWHWWTEGGTAGGIHIHSGLRCAAPLAATHVTSSGAHRLVHTAPSYIETVRRGVARAGARAAGPLPGCRGGAAAFFFSAALRAGMRLCVHPSLPCVQCPRVASCICNMRESAQLTHTPTPARLCVRGTAPNSTAQPRTLLNTRRHAAISADPTEPTEVEPSSLTLYDELAESGAPHAVERGGILGGAPPSLLRTQRAALMTVRTSLKSSRAGREMSSARASCERDARVRAAAPG